MKKPLVSVHMSAYNHERFVEKAIMSIINQSYGYDNIELIVIDDNSPDSTGDIIERIQAKYHFRFIRNKQNQGVVRNLNTFLGLSNGDYLAGCASDDFWHEDFLIKTIEKLQSLPEEYGVCHTAAHIIDEKGKELYLNEKGKSFTERIFPKILIENGIVAPASVVRKVVYDTVGLYDTAVDFEDRDMWIRVSQKYKFAYIQEPLVYRRMTDNNLSRDYQKNYEVAMDIFNKYKGIYEQNNLIDAFNYHIFYSNAGVNTSVALHHLKECFRYSISKRKLYPFLKLLVPRFIFTSSRFLWVRKKMKKWN